MPSPPLGNLIASTESRNATQPQRAAVTLACYVEPVPDAGGDLRIVRARGLAAYHAITHFLYAFCASDRCELVIGVRNSDGFDATTEQIAHWLQTASESASFSELPPIRVEPLEPGITREAFGAAHDYLLDDRDDAERMYLAYVSKMGLSAVSDYDADAVADYYDPVLVPHVRRRHPQFNIGAFNPDDNLRWMSYANRPAQDIRSVLDIGCGGGMAYAAMRLLVREQGFRPCLYTGVDFSRREIFRAKRNFPEAVFHPRSATRLGCEDAAYDIAISYGVFVHIPLNAQLTALREMLRVARCGTFARIVGSGPGDAWPSAETIPQTAFNHLIGQSQNLYFSHSDRIREIIQRYDQVSFTEEPRLYFVSSSSTTTCKSAENPELFAAAMAAVRRGQKSMDVDGQPATILVMTEFATRPRDFVEWPVEKQAPLLEFLRRRF